jgi:hypothetical protein
LFIWAGGAISMAGGAIDVMSEERCWVMKGIRVRLFKPLLAEVHVLK